MPEINFETILPWIDILWLPVLLLLVHKKHKLIAASYVIFCMITMRMEVELIKSFGYEKGIIGLFDMDLLQRGQITFAAATLFYLIISLYSRYTKPVIYMAASLTIYFFASILALIAMIL